MPSRRLRPSNLRGTGSQKNAWNVARPRPGGRSGAGIREAIEHVAADVRRAAGTGPIGGECDANRLPSRLNPESVAVFPGYIKTISEIKSSEPDSDDDAGKDDDRTEGDSLACGERAQVRVLAFRCEHFGRLYADGDRFSGASRSRLRRQRRGAPASRGR